MNKRFLIFLLFGTFITSCTNEGKPSYENYSVIQKGLLKNDNLHEIDIPNKTNQERIELSPGNTEIKIFGNVINNNDTIALQEKFQIQVKIQGIPDSLVNMAITNGTISRLNNETAKYWIRPNGSGKILFSIGFKDSLNSETIYLVDERWIYLK